MNVTKIDEKYLVSTFYVFFLIHASQTGIGMLNFQRVVAQYTEQDAWISVIIMGLSTHLIVWMIYKMLLPSYDILAIHDLCLGRILGKVISTGLVLYFLLLFVVVFRTYIEIIQLWIFPWISTWELGLFIGFIIYYFVSGGFRILTGLAFFGVVLPSILFFTLYFPLRYAHLDNLIPILNHSFIDILKSSKSASLVFVGFETLVVYLPYIKNPEKSKKWAHIALLYTTFLYVVITLVTLVYYSQGQLQETLWPTISMAKIIELPFIERFEYIFIFTWFLVILPTVCIPIWSCTRLLKKMYKMRPKLSLPCLMIFIYIVSICIENRAMVDTLGNLTNEISFYFVFLYIPALFFLFSIRRRLTNR